MLSPCLVHFPDRDPRIVLHAGDGLPRLGEVLISGWVVERQAVVDEATTGYDIEVWVKPMAA